MPLMYYTSSSKFQSFRLFLLYLFQFCDFRFFLGYHLGELFLAFLSRLGVDVEFLSLAVGQSRIKTPFPQVFVHLIYAPRPQFSSLGLVRLDKAVNFTRYRFGRLILRFGYKRACTADFAVNFYRRLQPHRVRDVRVDIQGRFRADMPDNPRQRFHVHSVLYRHRCKRMP